MHASRIATLALLSLTAVGACLAAAAFPVGDFETGSVTLSFGSDGAYRVLQGGHAMVEGTYRSDGDKLTLTDVSGQFACPAEKAKGTYTWRLEGKALTLTTVDDACEDRSSDLTGHPWAKK